MSNNYQNNGYGYGDSNDRHFTRPISAWGYVLYQILFAIPVVGWIVLLICALAARNLVLRSFARSYFCVALLVLILVIVLVVLLFATGMWENVMTQLQDIYNF